MPLRTCLVVCLALALASSTDAAIVSYHFSGNITSSTATAAVTAPATFHGTVTYETNAIDVAGNSAEGRYLYSPGGTSPVTKIDATHPYGLQMLEPGPS